jgi:hypothetical protein
MHGSLPSDLIAALADVGVDVPSGTNALPALTAAARQHDLSLRIESGAVSRRQAELTYRAVVWPSVCGHRESQTAQLLAARGYGDTGAEALARALLVALKTLQVARARELAVA